MQEVRQQGLLTPPKRGEHSEASSSLDEAEPAQGGLAGAGSTSDTEEEGAGAWAAGSAGLAAESDDERGPAAETASAVQGAAGTFPAAASWDGGSSDEEEGGISSSGGGSSSSRGERGSERGLFSTAKATAVYGEMMAACQRARMYDEMWTLYGWMKEDGIYPDGCAWG